MPRPFQAVVLIAFGGPQGPADVRPFLANVLRGRRVAPERVEEVAHHYELFGGVSPITELTRQQADGLKARLEAEGPALPVFVGMRNWPPYIEDTLRAMSAEGIGQAIGLILAPHRSYSSCQQYRENVRDARRALLRDGQTPPDIVYVDNWHAHAGFVEACARHVTSALERLDAGLHAGARLIFTAHSIPTEMAERFPYREQLLESARLVAARANRADWALVYQSRSGRPEDSWLEPDICDYLREEHGRGLSAAVIAPIGFVSDHIEVLYDLDREAAAVCEEIGLPMVRAESANADPAFLDMLADVVRRTWDRYARGRPLSVVMPE
jgi:protoporphyrin/coproporphyrin ferrochelatase